MAPTRHFPDWFGRTVAVLGARVVGTAVTTTLLADGVAVDVYDDHAAVVSATLKDLEGLGARICSPPTDWKAALADIQAIIPSPGVPPTHAAFAAASELDIPIVGDLDLAGSFIGSRSVIGVTGTNGKTTVTQLIEALLNAGGMRAVACGNYGVPFIEAVADDQTDVFVVEVSSFQLHYSESFHPNIAVLTSLAEDHLDWHGSFSAYLADKAKIFERFEDTDCLIADIGDTHVAALTSALPPSRFGYAVAADGSVTIETRGTVPKLDIAECLPPQAANIVEVRNRVAAAAVGAACGLRTTAIRAALEHASRFPHRLELVGQALGVRYVDDSKATNPHATLAALDGLESVILIAGGRNKGLDLAVLAERSSSLKYVVCIGESAPEISRAFEGKVPTRTADSMRTAVGIAAEIASPGDTVLLSPACASFDWYGSYAERGEDFANEVRNVTGGQR